MTNQKKLLVRGEKLVNQNPAIRKPDWLPSNAGPGLNELHTKHVELLTKLGEATDEAADLRNKYKAEDDAREKAALNGEPAPTVTPESVRQDTLGEAMAEATSAGQALYLFVAEAIKTIQENKDEWAAALTKRAREAEDKRAEALRLLDEADEDAWVGKRAGMWLTRTAEDKPMRHIAFATIAGEVPRPKNTSIDLDTIMGRA
jgi:hypothetical protein